MNLFELGLSFRDCQLIEAYHNLQICQLRYDRANAVFEKLYKELNNDSASDIAKQRVKIAEAELYDAKAEFAKKAEELRK